MNIFRKSIAVKIFVSICLMAIIFILIFQFSFTFLYEKYVMFRHRELLSYSYDSINQGYNGNASSVSRVLRGFNYRYGIKAMLIGEGYVVEFRTDDGILSPNEGFLPFSPQNLLRPELVDSLEEGNPVFLRAWDRNFGMEFLVLAGKLSRKNLLLLSMPLPLIENNVSYARVFSIWMGTLALVACLFMAFIISSRISRPLKEITHIAKAMADLDFSHKYSGSYTDEVGLLGHSINTLSNYLEHTIGNLKISNAMLENEIAKAHKRDEMRQAFLANVSHELKTPLALVQGYAEGLKMNINNSEEDKNFYCNVILEESARMAKIVRQILSLTKMEVGYLQPELEIIDLSLAVKMVCDKNALLLEKKNIKLINKTAAIFVYADADMFEQVVLNYFTNAVNHCYEKGIIYIHSESGENQARLYIFNEGPHIPEEDMENIWLSFYKVDKARTRAYGGSGIGLSVVKVIMDAHKGAYGVANIEGGVEFWADWNLAPAAETEITPKLPDAEKERE
jgi:signal transduction histidine kinase